MPEGDTIWRTARNLGAALDGRMVTEFDSPVPGVIAAAKKHHLIGSQVLAVDSMGKHLLMRFSSGATLRTHLRMKGSWHLYRRGTPWRKPAYLARVTLGTDGVIAVCFNAPVVEIFATRATAVQPELRRLGPDLLADTFEPGEARARLRSLGEVEIGVALLNQTALAGIGNVYKSEVLFLCGVDPFARVSALDDATLDRLIETARQQLKRNLGPGWRRTTPEYSGAPLWVYGHTGQRCRRCGTSIRSRLQGEQARLTFWCPTCQALRSGNGPS